LHSYVRARFLDLARTPRERARKVVLGCAPRTKPLTRSTVQYSQIVSVSWLLLGLSTAACSSADAPKPPATMNCTTFHYITYKAGTMPRTSADVLAIVNNATTCGTVACHQNPINPPAIAGPNVTAASLSAALVNVASPEVPS